ncbi:hypothetical protein V8F33_012925 [Rhypophila sp. PSN 637]
MESPPQPLILVDPNLAPEAKTSIKVVVTKRQTRSTSSLISEQANSRDGRLRLGGVCHTIQGFLGRWDQSCLVLSLPQGGVGGISGARGRRWAKCLFLEVLLLAANGPADAPKRLLMLLDPPASVLEKRGSRKTDPTFHRPRGTGQCSEPCVPAHRTIVPVHTSRINPAEHLRKLLRWYFKETTRVKDIWNFSGKDTVPAGAGKDAERCRNVVA